MHARRLPRSAYDALAASTRALVEANGGPKEAAGLTRTDAPRLSRFGDRHDGDRWIPADVVADLEDAAGEPLVSRTLARLAGYALVPLPQAEAPARADWLAHLAQVAREGGDVVAGLSAALADGQVSGREAADLRREVREQMDVLAVLDALLAEREGER